MYGYNVDQGLNTALKRVGTSVGEVTGPVTNTLGQQIEQRPWLVLGAALIAGFVLGSMGGDGDADDREQLWRNEERARTYRGMAPGRAPQPRVTYYSASGDHAADHVPATGGYSTPDATAHASHQVTDTSPPSAPPRPQPAQPNAISSTISSQVDKLTATAVPTIRNLLRDTLRDNVPAVRDHVDALDRRDGRTPPAPKPAQSATTLRDVDTYK